MRRRRGAAKIAIGRTIRDIADRKREDDRRGHLVAVVEASADAIIGKDLDGTITSWNRGAQRVFGYAPSEMIGSSIFRMVPEGRENEERHILEQVRRGETIEGLETVRRRKDGTEVDVLVTTAPIRDAIGTVIGASKVAHDITRRKRVESALAQAKEMAESANRELEAFSYSVAHDLRAPLRGMNGFARLLAEGYGDELDANACDWLDEIQRNAAKMGELIDALLSLARLTRSDLRRDVVDLSSLVRKEAAVRAAADPTRDVEIVVEDGLRIDADPVLACALVENLFANAWKFTSKVAKPRIELGAAQKEGTTVYFIRDNGAGFDMAFADKLFAPFQRLHTSIEFPGTGIGLATVQRIVHRHGGRLWAEGIVDVGATFYFSIPSRGALHSPKADAMHEQTHPARGDASDRSAPSSLSPCDQSKTSARN